ncbi:MAG: methyltransferase [Myxococcota bacterium]
MFHRVVATAVEATPKRSRSVSGAAWALVLVMSLCGSSALAIEEAVEAAMALESRSEADRERDANRKPAETLAFFGLEADDRVLELFPGGGWYTKILAPVLAEEGKLLLFQGQTDRLKKLLDENEGLENVAIAEGGGTIKPTAERGIFEIEGLSIDEDDIDLVLTFRNLHNFTPESRKRLYAEVLETLVDGGRFGVVDHTRRHMAPDTREVWRRLDPVLMIQEITEAGFRFVGYSDLHYRPDDELRYEVGRKSVKGNTDRFTLLFEKVD